MKRIVSLVLALSMVLSMFSFAFAGTSLPDVEGTDYEAAVSALVELGIVNGYEDGTYKADRTVTRAEMAKFLVVSAGLEPAAEVNRGNTNFSDVSADHWASGYINVASQYGYINGYPEGTFNPDATVSYAEAVTMAIRVLGYKSVVEAKGTWPTNYIAKAQELKVLDEVKYGKYTDGATRGNVALLMWNMLTTNIWDVASENENNGLTYMEVPMTMIDKYFDDYNYYGEEYKLVVDDITVADGKVTVTLDETEVPANYVVDMDTVDAELATGVDFLNLHGRVVSVLYNEKEEKIVMIIPSNDDRVVADYRDELSGDKYVFSGEQELVWGTASSGEKDYTVAVLGTKKNVEYTTRYQLKTSIVVDELKTKNDEVKVNGSELSLDEDAIVLIDGEWATADDIELDDVITELVKDELYIVSRETVTGSFDAVTEEQDSEEYSYFVTVDGEAYSVVNGIDEVVELDEEGEVITTTKLANIIKDDESKYYEEEAKLYLNFLGEVVKITFGEVEDSEDTGYFYVLTNAPEASWTVSDKSGTTTYVELNGESYEVKGVVKAPVANVSGDVVYVEFDSRDRVKTLISIPASGDAISGDYVVAIAKGSGDEIYNEDTNTVSGDFKVNSNTKVVTITPVEDEDDEDVVDYYEVETSNGAEALEGVEYAVVVSESGDAFKKAVYVFVWEDAKNTEKTHGIVEKYTKSNGVEYLTIDGTSYEVDEITDPSYNHSAINGIVKNYVGRAVEFIENEDGIKVTMSYGVSEVAGAPVVGEVEDARSFIFSGDSTVINLDTKAMKDDLEDAKIFLINVSEGDNGYEFDSYEEIEYSDIRIKKEDRIATNPAGLNASTINTAETIIIIRGFEG